MKKFFGLRPELTRPAVWAGAFTLAGLAMCALGLKLWIAAALLTVAAAAAAAVFRKSAVPLILALVLSTAAAVRFDATCRRAENLWAKYDGVEAVITGEVYTQPVYGNYSSEFVLKTGLGLVELVSYRETMTECRVGDRMTVSALLSAPEQRANDYGFDGQEYLMGRGIYLTAESTGQPKITEGRANLRRLAARVRDYALRLGSKRLYGAARELYPAIVMGDRTALSAQMKNDLSAAGLSHIAAVSGLHLSVLAVILMFLLSIPFGRRRFARLAAVPALIFFAFVTGCQPSVIRSCIMCVIFLLASVLYRENDGLSSLSAAFILMCLFRPTLIYSVGFQLSTASTLGILLFFEPLMRPAEHLLSHDWFDRGRVSHICAKLLRGAASTVSASIAAQLAALPISARAFHSVPLYALPANLLAVPVMTPLMAVGLAFSAFGAVPFLGGFLARACELLTEYIALVVKTFAALPHSTVHVGDFPLLLTVAYGALLLALFALYKRRKLACGLLTVIFVSVSAAGVIQLRSTVGRHEVCFLNTGRSDCTLFTSEGTSVLIDGGKNGFSVSEYLDGRGLFKLDCAVLTSAGLDHISGLITLVDEGYVERLYVPDCIGLTDRLETLLMAADDAGVPVRRYSAGGSISVGGLTLRAIDSGDDSVQLLAGLGGARILLCGNSVMDWEDCDIVRLPSHGAGSYNYYPEFHRHTPKYAVMTASGRNAAEKSKMTPVLEEMDIPVYIPAEAGTVTFDLDEDIKVRTTRKNYRPL